MKKLFCLLGSLLVLGAFCFADPVEGYWVSYDDKTNEATAGWEIWVENNMVYGKIIGAHDADAATKATAAKGKSYDNFYKKADIGTLNTLGTSWIWDLQKKAEGAWEKGFIVDPTDGSRYKCKMTFHAADGKKYLVDTLEMRGELGPFGRSQFWKKASKADAENVK